MRRLLLACLLALLLACPAWGATYYIDPTASAGGDGSEASPFDSWADVTWAAGNSYLQRRGTVLRIPGGVGISASGTSGNEIVIGSYGIGNKPKVYGSVLADGADDWTDEGSNIWVCNDASINGDVGNIIAIDSGVAPLTCGTKVSSSGALDTQGEFWYDSGATQVKMYSVGNPHTYYGDVELCIYGTLFRIANNDYIDIHDLILMYCGSHGISTTSGASHIHLYDLSVTYIGGSYLTGTTRYGNGISWQNSTSDLICERNQVSQCFDAGIGWEGDNSGALVDNIVVKNNYVTGCQLLFYSQLTAANSTQSNIVVAYNTWAHSGGWSFSQNANFPNMAFHARFAVSGNVSNYIYKNNIHAYEDASTRYRLIWGLKPATSGSYTFDNNIYFSVDGSTADKFRWQYVNYAFAGFEALPFVGDELWADPLLDGFRLKAGSPCIDAGTFIDGVTADLDGLPRPQGKGMDIGCSEYIKRVCPRLFYGGMW